MIGRSLLIYVTFSLCVTILFSTEDQKTIKNSLLGNEIIPIISQKTPSFKMYDFLIYPSNDGFKYNILPFLSSSEDLLKIILHFQKLDPIVNLRKFLPNSTIKKSVLDLEDSPFAYIFQDEYTFFDPILYSESNYKTCTINDKHIKRNSVCAFFPPNNIFLLKDYSFQNERQVYAGHNEENGMFFVACRKPRQIGDNGEATIKKNQGTLTPICRGNISFSVKKKFPDYLHDIVDAHNLTCFSKFYYKVFDFYQKYNQFVWKTGTMLGTVILKKRAKTLSNHRHDFFLRKCSWDNVCFGCLSYFLLQFFYYLVGPMVLYHAYMFPFYIVSIPFEILFKNHLIIYGAPKHFLNFLIFPCVFYSIFECCFRKIWWSMGFSSYLFEDWTYIQMLIDGIQIKPLKTMWVVPYLLQRDMMDSSEMWVLFFRSIRMFLWGIYSSLLFLPFFMIHSESYEE